jgi:hypothetical protein
VVAPRGLAPPDSGGRLSPHGNLVPPKKPALSGRLSSFSERSVVKARL